MAWQRWLRAAFALFGIGVAIVLYTRFNRKPAVHPLDVPPPLDSGVAFQSTMRDGDRQCRFENGKEVSCLSYSSFKQYTDGRRVLEQLTFRGDRGGKPFTMKADHAELAANGDANDMNKLPEDTHLMGHVVIAEEGGLEIHTEDAHYKESTTTLDIPGAMTFANGRMSGSGVGALYVKNESRLELRQDAAIAMAPDDAGSGRLAAKASSMRLNRASHDLNLDGGASIDRETDSLHALSMHLRLSDDEQGVQALEMRSQSSIVPVGSAQTPEMHGDDIDLAFQPDGRTMQTARIMRQARLMLAGADGRRQIAGDNISVRLAADGSTATGLTAVGGPLVQVDLPGSGDTPKRTIKARSMNGVGTEKNGLTGVVFDQAVEFYESSPAARGQAAVDRRVNAQRLSLTLNAGDLNDIKDARFVTGVRFADTRTQGTADDMTYVAKDGSLKLRPAGSNGALSTVTADRMTVKARSIDVDLNKNNIHAVGAVDSTSKPDASTASKGLFDTAKPVNGRANELTYDDEHNQAVYSGGARLFQGAGVELNLVQADKIAVDNDKGNLQASGGVQTQLSMDNMQTDGAPPRASGDTLEYNDAAHRAVYVGTEKQPAEFTGPDGKVRAVRIELITAAESRELQTMIADGVVVARIAADQTARGTHLNYDAKGGRYTLDGKPARLIKREVTAGVESCSQSSGESLTYTKAADGTGKGSMAAGKDGTGQASVKLQSCETWIIK